MGDGSGRRRAQGELESEVLAALWATTEALTPAEIQAELGDDLAYNTVHTILKRLFDKGLVRRDAQGRRGAYRPTRDSATLTADQMVELLNRGDDRIAVLRHLVSRLEPDEERALRALLDETDVP